MTELEKDQAENEDVDYKSEDLHERKKILGLSDLTTGQLKSLETSAIEKARNALVADKSDENYLRVDDKEMAQKMAEEDNKRIDELEEKLASEEEPTTKFEKIKDVITGRESTRDSYKKEIEYIKRGVPSQRKLTRDVAINSSEMAMEEKGVISDPEHMSQMDNVLKNDIAVKARHEVLKKVNPGGNFNEYDRYNKRGKTIL